MNGTTACRVRIWRWATCVLGALVVAWMPAAVAAAAEHGLMRSAIVSVTSGDLQRHVAALADDTFEGREAGSRGGHAAGTYLARQLRALGLPGAGDDGGYFQPFGAGYRNVLAWVEGSDEQLKQEVILIGAHYDHVGYGTWQNSYGPTGYIHNGADDNASGTSALLEIAEAVAKYGPRPRRSLLLAWWDGEEKGLLGSEHWAEQPTVALRRVRLAVNLDMVGRLRNERLEVSGTRTAAGLRRLVAAQNRDIGLKLDFTWDVADNSDHYSFFKRSIPFLMFHTGLHKDYHRPSDDVERVNFQGMQRVSRLLLASVYAAANEPVLSGFRRAARREGQADRRRVERPLPPLPGRLGVAWDPHDDHTAGVRVVRVVPGSAAERAGLQTGDRIVRFDGRQIDSPHALRSAVLAAEEEVVVHIRRAAAQEPETLVVRLSGRPMRLGIAWRTDDAEPNAVILTRVVPDSPADQAGLRVGDRIYEINGRSVTSGRQFFRLATSTPGPLKLLVERQGRLEVRTVLPIDQSPESTATETVPQ